jgi:transposase
LKKITDVLQADPQTVILAWDEAWLYCQTTLTSVWSPRGIQPVMTVSPQRDRIAFYGALNLESGEEHAIMTDKLNQLTTATFLEYVLDCYPERRILMIGDNASWHKGLPVATVLSRQPRLELFFLPVACPDLNPQEPIWSLARNEIHQRHLTQPFPQRVVAFLAFLRRIAVRPVLFTHDAPPILSFLND